VKLSRLLKSVKVKRITGTGGVVASGDSVTKQYLKITPEIKSVHYRAQDVKPGGLFVAVSGFRADGHDFIDEALARGASAVVVQKPVEKPVGKNSVVVEVENTRKALSEISANFYENPSGKLSVTGITGTNGKTTTAYLIESILSAAGVNVGVIGTINYRYLGKTFENPVTTPESLDLQRILSDMLKEGITHVIVEVSSHALDLFRVHNCWFDVGVFTNLTRDHLDYHDDMESYGSCKEKLFTKYLNSGPKKDRATAVINCNDPLGKKLVRKLPCHTLSVGHFADNTIRPGNVKLDITGIEGKILATTNTATSGEFDFISPLVGAYNLENILCAVGAGFALNFSVDAIKAGIRNLSFVPGRLERVPGNTERFVYIDYAHTPDALENVLSSIRSLLTGGTDGGIDLGKKRIICIFGCGGDRDKGKRPRMGEIAAKLCDLVIITSDNPRREAPMEIISQIVDGTNKVCLHKYDLPDFKSGFQKKGYVVEPDRANAINLGIAISRPGDIVLIAGKGHETYQIIGKNIIPFDDKKEAIKALLKYDS